QLGDEGGGNVREEQAREGRLVVADGPQLVALLAELRGPVVVDALALPPVLEAVPEGAQVKPAERAGKTLAAGGEPRQVVVELDLEEVPVLVHVARGGVGEAERVGIPTLRLRADADGVVAAEPEPHLTAIVERERAGGERERRQQRHQRGRQRAGWRLCQQAGGL